jgi:ABC-type transport system involved in cytochrome c biogenesis ATPase subunit/GNAT superfamily N-acetyltransferase
MQSPIWPSTEYALVKSISSRDVLKSLHLQDGRILPVHRFACVGVGDTVRLQSPTALFVKTLDAEIPVIPAFSENTQPEIVKGIRLPVRVHEIIDNDDLSSYEALAQFHYRSEQGFGRRSILLMTSLDARFPKELGFVEVTTPFLHLRNRTVLFDSPFCDPNRGVSWTKWDVNARNRLTNVVARISRIVVHPEVRGLGLSKALLAAAARYCSSRWQVKGLRPLFLEITADMLKFMPFVAGNGMRFIGTSEGNVGRLAKDMGYLTRAAEAHEKTGKTMTGKSEHSVLTLKGKGILGRQKRDVTISRQLKESLASELAIEEMLQLLINSGDVDPHAAEALLPLLRYPKPTYMRGLSRYAEAFLQRRTNELGLVREEGGAVTVTPPCSGELRVRNVTIEYTVDNESLGGTPSGEIRRAFGLARSFRFRTGVQDLTFTLGPGQLCYIFGASGAGKTSLLNFLRSSRRPHQRQQDVAGEVIWPSDAQIAARAAEILTNKPLVDAIGARSLVEAVYALNSAGLAEPRLYLSNIAQLSAGQVYRAQLAQLICSDANVWLLDEFGSGLDDATAIAVGRSFARAARRKEAICIVATVRREPLLAAMQPDVVITLNQLGKSSVEADWKGNK